MKKIMILVALILSLFLLGCNNKDIDTSYFYDFNVEIGDCEDTCVSNPSEFYNNYDVFKEKLDYLYSNLVGNHRIEAIDFKTGDTYSRNRLVMDDVFTSNEYIPIIQAYNNFEIIIEGMKSLNYHCSDSESCDGAYTYVNVSDFEYGFNNESGYYSYSIDNNTKIYARFKFIGNELDYESIRFNTVTKRFNYIIFKDNVFQVFHYNDENNYSLKYINLDNNEYLYIGAYASTQYLYLYIPDSGIRYEKRSNNDFTVSVYDEMKFVASINYNSNYDQYLSKISFMSMSGWDEVYVSDRGIKLLNNEEEVFTRYGITESKLNDYYQDLFAYEYFTKSQLSKYEFPNDLDISYSKDELLAELNHLMKDSFLYDKLSITNKSVFEYFQEIEVELSDRFSE